MFENVVAPGDWSACVVKSSQPSLTPHTDLSPGTRTRKPADYRTRRPHPRQQMQYGVILHPAENDSYSCVRRREGEAPALIQTDEVRTLQSGVFRSSS